MRTGGESPGLKPALIGYCFRGPKGPLFPVGTQIFG